MVLASIGDLTYSTYVALLDPEPFPSVADPAYLAFYLGAVPALALLLGRRLRDLPRGRWIDGFVTVLAMGSLLAAFLVVPIENGLGSGAAAVVGLAYPVLDSVLLLAAALGLVLLGTRGEAALWGFSGALALMAGADLAYWVLVSVDGYHEGTLLDALWPLANLILVGAAWAPAKARAARSGARTRVLLPPSVSLAVAVGVLVYGTWRIIPGLSVALAAASLLGVLTRLGATVAETARMIDAQHAAATDELTGVTNRRGFIAAAAAPLATSTAEHPVALLMLDLDDFKRVNDTLGHQSGDHLLAEVADRLRDSLRSPDDVLGRLGGDEFALLLPEADRHGAEVIAARITAALAAPFLIDGVAVASGASIGIAVAPSHGRGLSELLGRADRAMYRAKTGRLGPQVYEEQPDDDGVAIARSERDSPPTAIDTAESFIPAPTARKM